MIARLVHLVPLLAIMTVLVSCATVPDDLAAPEDAPASAVPEVATACTQSTEQARRLNGLVLLQAAAACFREQRPLDGTFLLITGQVRSITDMSLLEPKDPVDERARGELYTLIRSRAGGPGYDEFYRDPALTRDLFAQLEGWRPVFFEGYDPGWAYERQVTPAIYERAARKQAAFRLAQLRRYAELIRHDDYYAASRELAELRKRNPRGFQVNTPDALRAAELLQVMKRVDEAITTPKPRLEDSESHRFEPANAPLLGGPGGPDTVGWAGSPA